MTTFAITISEWNSSKFKDIPVTQAALNLINKSEILKSDIRAYQTSNADNVELLTAPRLADSASYRPPAGAKGGQVFIGINRVSTPEGTFNILAHELGHFRVESPGAAIANARANARAVSDKVAYEAACNLTEGFAKLNEFKARDEAIKSTQQQAIAEGRPLNIQEQILIDRWLGLGGLANSPEVKDYRIVDAIRESAKFKRVRSFIIIFV